MNFFLARLSGVSLKLKYYMDLLVRRDLIPFKYHIPRTLPQKHIHDLALWLCPSLSSELLVDQHRLVGAYQDQRMKPRRKGHYPPMTSDDMSIDL